MLSEIVCTFMLNSKSETPVSGIEQSIARYMQKADVTFICLY